MTDQSLVDLSEKIKALSPPEKLRLAAGLLERGKAQLAHAIARRVTDELGAALALSRVKRKPGGER